MGLQNLIINETDLDIDLLEKIIRPYVGIAKGNGEIIFTPNATRLTAMQRILVYLLGKKAAKALRRWPVAEHSSPMEIAHGLGYENSDRIRPVIYKLYESRLINKENEKYFVPNYRLHNVQTELMDDDDIPF